ncbi:myb-like protein X isoform X4 [Amphiprion ocellaris]|uniref:myb-like protein X isoform X4 n=1 Tax=Amphiprion ocellaris TaxID=80972 RepID=UPI002410C120|nr:myb-like protein X isoform X4 [Amphiprion ocellaris]
MGTQGTGRKRSTKKERSTAEDDALNLIAREAEARLAAKRAARAEAREIRMKELERQQKEIFQVQKKYYGLNTKIDDRMDSKWGDIEQWMEDSERYSRSSRRHTLSDEDERMSVGSRGSVRSDLDAVGAYGVGGSSLHKKSKKKKKHKHKDRDRNGYDDDYSVMSSRSSRLSDESRVSRSSRLDLTSSMLGDDSRVSRASRLDLQPASYASSDMYSLSSSRNPSSAFNGYQSSLYEDSLCSGSRRVTGSSSHDNCSSVASFLRSAASSSALPRDLDDVTIPDFSDVEDRDYLEKGSRAASALTAGTLTSLGGTSSRRGSGETALTVDAESSIREIKEIHELKDQIQDVETKYTQNLKEAKDALAEVEEKYRKAMVSNAQLDNEKNNLMYQVDTLKDSLMELEELLSESRREYEEKVKEYEREKHAHGVLQFQFSEMKEMLKQSEELLNDIRQLRMKQDSFVREISDLQETVEWKDKKIGALERQKEYTDAIRIERDELREEVVQLKDILKKHGIVLGPDLNINGDVGESEVDGSPGADPASRSAQDSQTSPTEGNSMLGNTEETEMRSSREEEVDPEQQQEMLQEVKENHLSSEIDSLNSTLCNVADVDTSSEKQLSEEQQANLPTEEDGIRQSGLSKDLTVDIHDSPTTEAKDVIACSSEPQHIHPVTSPEENVSETEISEGGNLKETRYSNLGEAETKNNSVETHSDVRDTCTNLYEKQDNKQEGAEESDLSNTEPCPQQKATQDVMKESVSDESVPAASNTEPQQGCENADEADNIEAEEIPGKSASGKKKKKKKKGKKKGGTQDNKNQQKDGTNKENKTDKDEGSAARNDGSTTEPKSGGPVTETFEESKVDQVKKEQDKQETVEADAVEPTEPTENFSNSEAVKEPRTDHLSNENDEKQSLETKTLDNVEVVNLTVVNMDQLMDKQNEEQPLETETVESVHAVEHTERFSHVDTLKESRTDSNNNGQDEEQTLETETVESVEAVEPPAETLKETKTDSKNNGQDEEQTLETETVESVEAVEPPAETLKETRTDSNNNGQDEEQTLETETVESVEAMEPPAEALKETRTDSKNNGQHEEETLETETLELVEAMEPPAETLKETRTDSKNNGQHEEQTLETETVESVEAVEPPAETLKETRTDSKNNGQHEEQTLETETVESVEAMEPPAETLKETRTDSKNNGQHEEQTLETESAESIEAVEPPAETLKETRTDSKNNGQDEEQTLETETVESAEAVEPPAETLKEFRTDSKNNEQDDTLTSETENEEECETIPSLHPEASLCKSDFKSKSTESTDGLGTKSVDDSESKVLYTKSEIVGQVEAEVESADEMKPECTTKKPENSLETCSKESTEAESHMSSNDDVAANESEFINSSESKDNTSVSLPSTEDFNDDFKSLSESEPLAAMNLGNNDPPMKDSDQALEEATEAVADDGDAGAEIEEECIHQGRTGREDLNGDLKEPGDLVEPDCSLHDEKSDKTPSLTNTTEALASGKNLKAVVQNEQLDDAESKILECMDPIEESNAEEKTEEINTNAALDIPECPMEATENGSDTEQETDVPEDSGLKDSQHVKESKLSLCPLDEQPHDSKDKCESNDLSQPTQLLNDEDDGEDDEGMSFDFDDMDMEAAVVSDLPKNSEQEEVEEGVEVMLDETTSGSSVLCQSNTQSNENTQVKPVESNDEKCTVDRDNQVDALDEKSNTAPQEAQNSLVNVEAASEEVENVCEEEKNTPKEEAGVADDPRHIAEEGKVLSVGGLGAVAESIKQTVCSLVEEGLDVVRNELQVEGLDLPKNTDQVDTNKEAPQPGRDVKKSSKKGKGKGKDDCKMS